MPFTSPSTKRPSRYSTAKKMKTVTDSLWWESLRPCSMIQLWHPLKSLNKDCKFTGLKINGYLPDNSSSPCTNTKDSFLFTEVSSSTTLWACPSVQSLFLWMKNLKNCLKSRMGTIISIIICAVESQVDWPQYPPRPLTSSRQGSIHKLVWMDRVRKDQFARKWQKKHRNSASQLKVQLWLPSLLKCFSWQRIHKLNIKT